MGAARPRVSAPFPPQRRGAAGHPAALTALAGSARRHSSSTGSSSSSALWGGKRRARRQAGPRAGRGAGGRASALTLRAPGPGPCLGRPGSAARLGGRGGPPPVRAEKVCAVRADVPHLSGGEGGAGRAALPARDDRAAPPEVRPAAATAAPVPAPRAASAVENSAGSGGYARSVEVWSGGRRRAPSQPVTAQHPEGRAEAGRRGRSLEAGTQPCPHTHATRPPAAGCG